MKQTLFFRLWSMMTILIYSTALAQAGQVIKQEDKSWAQEVMKQEAGLEAINTPNSIVVLNFKNKSGQAKLNPLQKGLAVMLISDLAKIEQLQMVERVRMQALLNNMNLSASGTVTAETIPTIGKLLGAYYVVSGGILKGKGRDSIAIDSSVLDTPFETVTRQPTVTGALDELQNLEKEVLFNIIDQLKIPVSSKKRAELKKPFSTNPKALSALFLGIEHSDNGQYAKAAKMYNQALLEDPDFKMAQSALQELERMKLTTVEKSLSAKPAEEGGYSMNTVLAVGLGVAVLGGAAAFAMSGSGGGDNNDVVVVNPPADTGSPTAIASPQPGSTLSCTSGSITFSFSEAMAQSGQISLSQGGFATSQGWQDLFYVISWSHDASFCNEISSLEVSLNAFQDSAGNALSGTIFSYSVGP